jgi:hypothetical protein
MTKPLFHSRQKKEVFDAARDLQENTNRLMGKVAEGAHYDPISYPNSAKQNAIHVEQRIDMQLDAGLSLSMATTAYDARRAKFGPLRGLIPKSKTLVKKARASVQRPQSEEDKSMW